MSEDKKVIKRKRPIGVQKQHEALTKNDLDELMGLNRPTYSRRRGAIRQK